MRFKACRIRRTGMYVCFVSGLGSVKIGIQSKLDLLHWSIQPIFFHRISTIYSQAFLSDPCKLKIPKGLRPTAISSFVKCLRFFGVSMFFQNLPVVWDVLYESVAMDPFCFCQRCPLQRPGWFPSMTRIVPFRNAFSLDQWSLSTENSWGMDRPKHDPTSICLWISGVLLSSWRMMPQGRTSDQS